MRWRVEEFIFCDQQQSLTSDQKTLQLEPMVVELLAYFCQHTDQIISRDQLIEQVWLGRFVTDNAVSKVITKLRKILADDVKKPRFIATFPKKGYKFIAAVTVISEPTGQTKASGQRGEQFAQPAIDTDKTKSTKVLTAKKLIFGVSTILLVLLAIGWFAGITIEDAAKDNLQQITQVRALTRAAGQESQPRISPNGEYLSYTEVRGKRMHLWIKSLSDESRIEINHGQDFETWVGPASWNNEGAQLAYLVTTPQSCQYFIRDIKGLSVSEPRLIHNCTSGSYGKIVFTHDNNRLIYTESEGGNSAYSLFELRLDSGTKRRLSQPKLVLGGNYQFDLHPDKNRLLISSPDKQQWEGFYSLDLETDELILLFKQDAYICCGIWSHGGDRVVLMGEHPAYQLVSYDLQGKNRRVEYTGSQQLRAPERHINGKDYLFVAGHINQNAHFFGFQQQTSHVIANTSVDDRLAIFAHHNDQIAYIGLASGNEEVWLTNVNGKQTRKLTEFNDSRHYVDLQWSYNGEYLVGLALNEIHIIDSHTGKSQSLKISQVEIRALSLKSDRIIAYSTRSEQGWQVNYYDIKTHRVTTADKKWQFIRFAKHPEDVFRVDQQGHIFTGEENQLILSPEILQADVLNGRVFNLKKSDGIWAWQIRGNGQNQLMIKKSETSPAQPLILTDSYHFDLSSSGMLYHTVYSKNADIYRSISD